MYKFVYDYCGLTQHAVTESHIVTNKKETTMNRKPQIISK